MSGNVIVKGIVAQSTFDYVRSAHGEQTWEACLARLNDSDRITVNAGGNVPLEVMGRFNEAVVAEVCSGSRSCAADEFRRMGAVSADKLLTGNGIFSIFARFVSPKQVLARAESVIKTAYSGVTVEVAVDPDGGGGTITISGMRGYPYGSQRIVGWLLRGIEIVGGRQATVTEANWDSGQIDSDSYVIRTKWEGWR